MCLVIKGKCVQYERGNVCIKRQRCKNSSEHDGINERTTRLKDKVQADVFESWTKDVFVYSCVDLFMALSSSKPLHKRVICT